MISNIREVIYAGDWVWVFSVVLVVAGIYVAAVEALVVVATSCAP